MEFRKTIQYISGREKSLNKESFLLLEVKHTNLKNSVLTRILEQNKETISSPDDKLINKDIHYIEKIKIINWRGKSSRAGLNEQI